MSCGRHAFNMADHFDARNSQAVAWARTRSAQLVTNITKETRNAIQQTIAHGIKNGVSPAHTARIIRDTIGLTERQSLAVMNRQIRLLASGMDAERAMARSHRYAASLLRSRADTIARTETMRAVNEGQSQLWAQAREHGLLSGREQKVWITDEETDCPICEPLDGEAVDLDDDFSIGEDPPAHPNCRCTMGIVMPSEE